MVRPLVSAIRPRMPANWRIWFILPRAPESAIMKMGLKRSRLDCNASVTSLMVFSHWETTRR